MKNINILVDAGVPEAQAKAQIQVLEDFREAELATKRDLKELEYKLTKEIESAKVTLILAITAIMGFFTMLPKLLGW